MNDLTIGGSVQDFPNRFEKGGKKGIKGLEWWLLRDSENLLTFHVLLALGKNPSGLGQSAFSNA